jgi:hypothetical protein
MVGVRRDDLLVLPLDNRLVAERLEEVAELLESRGSNPFRAGAYRNGAATVRGLKRAVAEILAREGTDGLTCLPGIGRSLARAIERLTMTGRLGLLTQLRGGSTGELLLETVAGIGSKTAAKIHDELGIETLADLEAASYDGRLARIPGMGPKRIRAVRESLAGRFRQRPRVPEAATRRSPIEQPPVAELLSIDEEFRRKAQAGRLLTIAPRRFNPSGEAWLPILHARRGDRQYTALFSNTARAHELGTLRDWVVIYRTGRGRRGQWTVITAHLGRLKGRRVVRGREAECATHYFSGAVAGTTAANAVAAAGDDV